MSFNNSISRITSDDEISIIQQYNQWQDDNLNRNNILAINLLLAPLDIINLNIPKAYTSVHVLRGFFINFKYSHGRSISLYASKALYQKFLKQADDKLSLIAYNFIGGFGMQVYLPDAKSIPLTYQPYLGVEANIFFNLPIKKLNALYPGMTTAFMIKIEVCNTPKQWLNIGIGIQLIKNQAL